MHLLGEAFMWAPPFGCLLFVAFGGILGFVIAGQKRVWLLSSIITMLTFFLIPWSLAVEVGHSMMPIVYFVIVPVILTAYWVTLGLTRLFTRNT